MTDALEQKVAEATKLWDDVELALKHCRRVLLFGPPGTGKSYAGLATCGAINRCYLTLDTPAAEIRGHFVPSEAGGFHWHDGPASVAWRKGERLAIEEIDAASGDTLTLLLGYLDDPESAVITLPNNEHIRPAEGFSCVATTNQLPSVIPDALLDRFDAVIHVPLPNPKAFCGAWNSNSLKDAAKKTIYLAQKPPAGKGNRPIGLRAFKAIDRIVGTGLELPKAAEIVIGKEASAWLCASILLADTALAVEPAGAQASIAF
jgi:MoxR-like ATPase